MAALEPFKEFLFDTPNASTATHYETVWDAIRAEPNQPWDWFKLSKHPGLEWGFVMEYVYKPWNWREVSKHSGLVFDDVRTFSDKNWDWTAISDHPNITLKMIADYPDYFWSFTTRIVPVEILEMTPRYRIHAGSALYQPWPIILGNKDVCWDWATLSRRGDLSWDIVIQHPDKPWDWRYVSRRHDLTLDIVEKMSNKDWDWMHLTKWLCDDFGILRKFPRKSWDFTWLSRYIEIDWEVFWELPHPYGGWDYPALYTRTQNIDLLLNLPNIPWEFKKGVIHKILSWDVVKRCMEETGGRVRFPWRDLSARKDIPWGLIVDTCDAWPWDWRTVSGHPCLTFRFYCAHPEYPWSHAWVRARFKAVAARRIQGHWRRCVANPEFLVCRRRLLYEYNTLCL
jgi:hypothetical protein